MLKNTFSMVLCFLAQIGIWGHSNIYGYVTLQTHSIWYSAEYRQIIRADFLPKYYLRHEWIYNHVIGNLNIAE